MPLKISFSSGKYIVFDIQGAVIPRDNQHLVRHVMSIRDWTS